MLETLSWLWFLAKFPDLKKQKIIFISPVSQPKLPAWVYEFFDILGINPENVQLIMEPAVFKKITVPEPSFFLYEGFYKEYEDLITYIKNKIPDKDIGKIYLTRSKLKYASLKGLGEGYFEDFYKKQGYEIIAPEQLKIIEQLTIWKNAKDIVCTEGTLAHAAVFSAVNANITILRRSKNLISTQAFINEIANLNCTYISIEHNFLPTIHWIKSKYILGPTKYWKEFLLNSSYSYTEKDFEFDISPYVIEFIKSWADTYSKNSDIDEIISLNSQDYVNLIASEFCTDDFEPLKDYKKLNINTYIFLYQRFKFLFEIYYILNRFSKNITWGKLKARTSENAKIMKDFLNFVK